MAGASFVLVLVEWLEHKAKQLALDCPICGCHRKCKGRPGDEMNVRLLGCEIEAAKLYLECGRCDAPGISVTKMLTGLHGGSTSTQLELVAGFCAAQHSYAKANLLSDPALLPVAVLNFLASRKDAVGNVMEQIEGFGAPGFPPRLEL